MLITNERIWMRLSIICASLHHKGYIDGFSWLYIRPNDVQAIIECHWVLNALVNAQQASQVVSVHCSKAPIRNLGKYNTRPSHNCGYLQSRHIVKQVTGIKGFACFNKPAVMDPLILHEWHNGELRKNPSVHVQRMVRITQLIIHTCNSRTLTKYISHQTNRFVNMDCALGTRKKVPAFTQTTAMTLILRLSGTFRITASTAGELPSQIFQSNRIVHQARG